MRCSFSLLDGDAVQSKLFIFQCNRLLKYQTPKLDTLSLGISEKCSYRVKSDSSAPAAPIYAVLLKVFSSKSLEMST